MSGITIESVATCLAITIYEPQRKTGALAHISGLTTAPKGLRPDKVKLHYYSSNIRNLEATLSGEGLIANLPRNSPIVRAQLNKLWIKIIGEDLCKAPGRLVFLHCDTGMVEIRK
ncbi:MAG: hypothetical protein M1514_03445 [Patescibacteria group bacterium]|nr:hypothetical protein [Patescibacteria group bacterium]